MLSLWQTVIIDSRRGHAGHTVFGEPSASGRRDPGLILVRGQVTGAFIADVLLGVLATVIGSTHGAAWIIVPSALGVLGSGLLLRRCWTFSSGIDPVAQLSWWRRRGLSLMFAASIPIYVAIGCAAYSMAKS